MKKIIVLLIIIFLVGCNNKKTYEIVFFVNDSLLLKEEFDFYRKALINNGFETNDDIKFVYKLN